ncbi:MAG: macro domain-containing protein [Gammaproteobacteria bacterium]|nr:macro domain-containing protein [Gammaproteobacteria bacterium]MCW9031513.1 macro domain-containing protein [Gammaproteobacteria bacterium]
MSDTNKQTMQFLFGDRELVLKVADLLVEPVDVIVNPANGSLSHGGGVAGQISQQGGEIIQKESDLFVKEHGTLESGMVAFTSAGRLPFEAIIHAVGPVMGEGHEQRKIEQAVSSSLMLCNMHDWNSVAFPAISSGIFSVPLEISARAFFRAITSFWDARMDTAPGKVVICLTEKSFQPFFDAFQQASKQPENETHQTFKTMIPKQLSEAELPTGVVELTEQDISELENDDVSDWFK